MIKINKLRRNKSMLNPENIILTHQTQELSFLAESKNFTAWLPAELLIKIFEQITNRELSGTVCMVSKHWCAISSQDTLWHIWAVNLEIPDEEINQSKNKTLTIEKVIKLKESTQETDPLLDIVVKTAQEFNQINYSQAFNTNPLEEIQNIVNRHAKELNEKKNLSVKIKRGFYSHLLLRRIRLSSMTCIKKYALKLQTSYGFHGAWESIALEYIKKISWKKSKKF